MKDIKEIVFDMDGTIADLYGVDNWLYDLQNENTRPYEIANPLCDMLELVTLLELLKTQGIKIRVCSWLAMDSTKEYDKRVRQAKIEWLKKYGFPYDYCNIVAYGTKKQYCIKNKELNTNYILFDDSKEVRESWTIGQAINPTTNNIIEILNQILKGEFENE